MSSIKTNYLLASDMSVRPELLGLQTLLMPFPQNVSAQRGVMFASNSAQAIVVNGSEMPYIFTGWESTVGKYEYDSTEREQDIQVLAVIPKYRGGVGINAINNSPTTLVIYQGLEDHKLNYFEQHDFTELGDTFGYYNKKMNQHMLLPGNVINKETKFVTAPNHDGEFYAMGFNANVCFLSHWDVNEDSFIISDRIAKLGMHEAFDTVEIDIDPDVVPINLFGDDLYYKLIPDIGENCRKDGLVCAFRPKNSTTFLSDMLPEELQKVEVLHDTMFYAHPNAKIVDVEVYINQGRFNSYINADVTGNTVFSQLLKYRTQLMNYYKSVVDITNELRKTYPLSTDLNALIRQYLGMLATANTRRDSSAQLMNYREPIEFIKLKITYQYTREIAPGSKLTGRDGSKGVVGSIWKYEDMPVDDFGNRADIIIAYTSCPNRMNPSQMDEQFLNSLSTIVRRNIQNMPLQTAYDYLMEYFSNIRPVMRTLYERAIHNDEDKAMLIKDCIEKGIYLCVSPYSVLLTPERVLELAEKYGYKESPVEYNTTNPDGSKTRVRTEKPACIGSKYLLVLGKLPEKMCSVVSCSYLSQFGTPIRPNSGLIKAQNLVSKTPIRTGEHETEILVMAPGPEPTARALCLYSNSLIGAEQLAIDLATHPNPTQLDHVNISTDELINTSVIVKLFKHQLGVVGYDFTDDACNEEVDLKRQSNLLDQRVGGK